MLVGYLVAPTGHGAARHKEYRNHDEIRFWVDYLNDTAYIEDDSSWGGGLDRSAAFVIVGSLNADPEEDNFFREAGTRYGCRVGERPRSRLGRSSTPGGNPRGC